MKRIILLAPLAVVATACSTHDQTPDTPTGAATPTTASASSAPSSAPSSASSAGADSAAVAQAVTLWDTTGPCELMTTNFLASQTFVSDRALACKAFRASWQPKQYSASDVIISQVEVSGNTAHATLGSKLADLTVRFSLVRGGPAWQIDSASAR